MEFTEQQINAIGMHRLGVDTCVVAGPGSGKTTVLIERFRSLVASGVHPLRILAITFTEKATANMRSKLMAAFAGQAEILSEIQRAWVSTVDGFCTRLLKENAIQAGLDPRFRVWNEIEAAAQVEASAADSLDAYFADHAEAVRLLLRSLDSPELANAL
ncbi:MAG: UvrD-helicase domain-containing protein, partial [Bryobacteraceae bacterium]